MNKIELLQKLKLDLDLFAFVKLDGMSLDKPLAQHAGWAFKHIYSKAYLGRTFNKNKPAREHHGIEHVGRAAFYAPVFANFYRKYGDPQALALTEYDLKLTQIALLFHDSGRVCDGIDDTDEQSGLLLYFYLMELGVDKEKAMLLAEAVANKDVRNDEYKVLTECEGDFTWVKINRKTKNIYQKLVHDSDCIDIIRGRDKFEAKYLDFMQNIILHEGKIAQEEAFDELAFLIKEVRHVIEIQGDSHFNRQLAVKMQYQHEQAYEQLLRDVTVERHPILTALGKSKVLHTPAALAQIKLIDKTPYDKSKGMTADNLNAALREGKLFSRSVIHPSRFRTKVKTSGIQETYASVEVRKAARRKGKSTGTLKSNHEAKEGNPYRSTAMGGFTFTNAGFLIIDPTMSQINHISLTDFDSGFAKKCKWRSGDYEVSDEEKQAQLKVVLNELKSGGVYESKYKAPYTEILCTLTGFDAIFYNHDACMVQLGHQPKATPWHRHAPYLQALYLRQEYAKWFHVNLPIFYYSGYECFIRQEREYSSQAIIKMWEEMLADHIRSQLAENNFQVLNQTSQQLKVACVYSAKAKCNNFLPVDAYYDLDMQDMISSIALRYQKELGEEYEKNIRKKLETQSESIIESKLYLYLIATPWLSREFKEIIEQNIAQHLASRDYLNPPFRHVFSASWNQNEIQLKSIYALAISCQSEKYVKQILQLVRNALDQILAKMQNNEALQLSDAPVNTLGFLIEFASGFGLCESYQAQFINQAKDIMKVNHWYYEKCKPHVRWWGWVNSLLKYLIKENHQAILVELKDEAKALLIQHHNLLSGGFQPNDPENASSQLQEFLASYLQLANFCDVSKEEQKPVIMSFFNKFNAINEINTCQFNFTNQFDRVYVLKELGFLSDNDVFQQVIVHLGDQLFDIKKNKLFFGAERYVNNLVLAAQAVPAKDLCDTKIEMLNKAFAKRVKNTHLQLLIDLLNKQTIHPVIALTEELQTIIVDECEIRLNQISQRKPEECAVSRRKEIAAFFALIEHLEQYEIQHPGFKKILRLKDAVVSQLQAVSVEIGKYKVVQPMFSGKAHQFKPQNTSNYTPTFWTRPNSVVCIATPKSLING